jgi:hypothetical protein
MFGGVQFNKQNTKFTNKNLETKNSLSCQNRSNNLRSFFGLHEANNICKANRLSDRYTLSTASGKKTGKDKLRKIQKLIKKLKKRNLVSYAYNFIFSFKILFQPLCERTSQRARLAASMRQN